MDARPVFYQRVLDRLQAACREAAADCPELEGAAIVCLWRLPGQADVPSVLLVGADGPLSTPDQMIRMLEASTRLARHCVDGSAAAVASLVALVESLAQEGRAHVRATQEPAGVGPGAGPADDAGDRPGRA